MLQDNFGITYIFCSEINMLFPSIANQRHPMYYYKSYPLFGLTTPTSWPDHPQICLLRPATDTSYKYSSCFSCEIHVSEHSSAKLTASCNVAKPTVLCSLVEPIASCSVKKPTISCSMTKSRASCNVLAMWLSQWLLAV